MLYKNEEEMKIKTLLKNTSGNLGNITSLGVRYIETIFNLFLFPCFYLLPIALKQSINDILFSKEQAIMF